MINNGISLNLLIAIIDYITSSQLKKIYFDSFDEYRALGTVRILLKRTYRKIN